MRWETNRSEPGVKINEYYRISTLPFKLIALLIIYLFRSGKEMPLLRSYPSVAFRPSVIFRLDVQAISFPFFFCFEILSLDSFLFFFSSSCSLIIQKIIGPIAMQSRLKTQQLEEKKKATICRTGNK